MAVVTVAALTACSAQPSIRPASAPTPAPVSRAPSSAPALRLPRTSAPKRVAARPVVLPTGLFAQVSSGGQVLATAVRVAADGPGQLPITVVTFSRDRVRLVLHAGTVEPAPVGGWRYGPAVGPAERRVLVAAFNGGFKMRDSRGGWRSEGRTIRRLVPGAASVVIYGDGGVDVGAWGSEVPQRGRVVASVRQNLQLLVDNGRPRLTHPQGQAQLDAWWGHAFRHQRLIARSALGVTADGALVWAAGDSTTVAALARALIDAGAVRALELDINAPLVRGFLFASPGHELTSAGGRATELPLVVGQRQLRHDPGQYDPAIAPHCTYLWPCSRDYFTVLLR